MPYLQTNRSCRIVPALPRTAARLGGAGGLSLTKRLYAQTGLARRDRAAPALHPSRTSISTSPLHPPLHYNNHTHHQPVLRRNYQLPFLAKRSVSPSHTYLGNVCDCDLRHSNPFHPLTDCSCGARLAYSRASPPGDGNFIGADEQKRVAAGWTGWKAVDVARCV